MSSTNALVAGSKGGQGKTTIAANLVEANLSWANLAEANLSWADLAETNLTRANLAEANLSWANLAEANLSWANLAEANLSLANLASTCLDPAATMPASDLLTAAFEIDGDDLIAYRTEKSIYIKGFTYIPGETYTATVFSVDAGSGCHPGLYFDTLDAARKLAAQRGMRIVKVRVPLAGALSANGKYRCKSLTVMEYLG